jgi:hypothetical protein
MENHTIVNIEKELEIDNNSYLPMYYKNNLDEKCKKQTFICTIQ